MYAKSVIESIELFHDELISIRRDIHAHPELGFQETRTSDLVARSLTALGYEVHRGVGKTGLVGVLEGRRNTSGRCIGLRADMDALPIVETGQHEYTSTSPGVMHACGHDGHTTMLLGAARYLAETRNFDGKVALIFQPAEEGLGGAQAMIDDGLFERFPCDAIYGVHNWPSLPAGVIGVCPGPAMAAADSFEIHIEGQGGHGARPNDTNDPIVIVGHLIGAFQTLVSRNTSALDSAVVTIASVRAGSLPAMNVIPKDAHLTGTVRTFSRDVQARIMQRMKEVTTGLAATFNAKISLKYHCRIPPTVNNRECAAFVSSVATELLGAENVVPDLAPTMGSEDFSLMLEKCPGTYFRIGQGGAEAGCLLHTSAFNFNDAVIPVGSAVFCRLVERSMPLM
ncbi:M20 aminoacylase family protein [Allopusillimonas ginsengisoli]|uniref:M20 aminoacylase family protein n=1 Tax=Allopusillimonas ginsengisoli TaxID=453575 RepID=UPI0010209EE4|nr:M20 aminoacylase family protein [Allopusillimonas ginsengisoli]TEA71922.1 amidohydrolase [Allopusillimonas ginsengisoli]